MFRLMLLNECRACFQIMVGDTETKEKKWKLWAFPLFFLFTIFLSSLSITVDLCLTLEQVSALSVYPLLSYTSHFFVLFFLGLFQISTVLFRNKDFDLISALPIPTTHIIGAKLSFIYLFQWILTLLILLPSWVYWWLNSDIDTGILIKLCSVTFFVPFIPIVCSGFLGVIVIMMSKKVRKKEIFEVIATLFLCIFIIYGSTLQLTGIELTNMTLWLQQSTYKILPWTKSITDISLGLWHGCFYFVVLSMVTMLVFVWFVARYYVTLHHVLVGVTVGNRRSKQRGMWKEQAFFWSLVGKEWKEVQSISVYMVNTLFGIFGTGGFLLYLKFFNPDLVLQLRIQGDILYWLPLVIASVFSITPMTACSLSLEGKQRWIVASLPIDTQGYLLSKLVAPLLLLIPTSLILSLGFALLFSVSTVWVLIYMLFPIVSLTFFHIVGLFLNLQFPNYQWTQASTVVKQGVPVLGVLACAMVFFGGFALLVPHVAQIERIARLYFLSILLLQGAIVVTTVLLLRRGEELLKGERHELSE